MRCARPASALTILTGASEGVKIRAPPALESPTGDEAFVWSDAAKTRPMFAHVAPFPGIRGRPPVAVSAPTRASCKDEA